ncbi:MAG: cell division protein FtsA [Patescibacteria group bacterium]
MSKNPIIAGLDIGSYATKILVAKERPDGRGFEVLGRGISISEGIRKGVINNRKKATQTISKALNQAEKEAGREINKAYVNINGSHIFCLSSEGLVSVSRADQKISKQDLERVIDAAKTFSIPSNKEIIEVIPQEYIVDDQGGIKEPLGLTGVRLEAKILAVGGFTPYIDNTSEVVVESGLEVKDMFLGSAASARSVLDSQERELGVAVVDLGAATTSISVFEEGEMIHTAVIPIGMQNVRNDIAIGLRVSIEAAEKILEELGSHILGEASTRRKAVDIPGGEEVTFKEKDLKEIAKARVEEIFELVDKELDEIERSGLLPGGIVLTGGGAKMEHLVKFVKKKSELPVRVGAPTDFYPSQEDPSLSTVCGLVKLGVDNAKGKGFMDFDFNSGLSKKLKKIFRIFIP